LRRVPGQQTLRYYLERDPVMQFLQLSLPSCRTIERILCRHQRILQPRQRLHAPVERPAPMSVWQIDFKEVSSVPAEPEGKRQHVVETLNFIETGTSVLLDAHVRSDFTAQTALEALAQTLAKYGRPKQITLDRDVRWVGSPLGSDFPAALLRFGACLGIEIHICAPRPPQENAFVERYHRTSQEECLAIEQASTLEQARRLTQTFVEHYNFERPHQGLACGKRPPRTAFPTVAPLPPLPTTVDPDSWVRALDGLHVQGKVQRHGSVTLALKRYYVSTKLAGRHVSLQLDTHARCVPVFLEQQRLKSLPLKGLLGRPLSFEQFLAPMLQQARSPARLRSWQERKYRRGGQSSP
jgi:transposase InsO family protein